MKGAHALAGGSARSGRAESTSERFADALVHVLGIALGVAGCIGLALAVGPGADPAPAFSAAVYGVGLLAMLACSMVYNVGGERLQRPIWRRLDHAAIFMMIAGTYTPFLVVAIGGAWGTGLLVFVWAVALAGMAGKMLRPERLEALSIVVYLLLGWTILIALDQLIAAVSSTALVLILTGGILYSLGVLVYRADRLPYNRAIWHGLVLIAAACQYIAVLSVVTG